MRMTLVVLAYLLGMVLFLYVVQPSFYPFVGVFAVATLLFISVQAPLFRELQAIVNDRLGDKRS